MSNWLALLLCAGANISATGSFYLNKVVMPVLTKASATGPEKASYMMVVAVRAAGGDGGGPDGEPAVGGRLAGGDPGGGERGDSHQHAPLGLDEHRDGANEDGEGGLGGVALDPDVAPAPPLRLLEDLRVRLDPGDRLEELRRKRGERVVDDHDAVGRASDPQAAGAGAAAALFR